MATEKTDFLKFNAYSMKELITRKMSEDSKFTDQIYEGSNLAILIDLVAYMYQVLVYQLNNAAAESMFSDTQIYENISRLVKMIGYNPRGCRPSQLNVYIYRETPGQNDMIKIPFYSKIDTGLTDSNGKKICFSTVNGQSEIYLESETYHLITLVNGEWKLYPTIFTASGVDFETFVLEDANSDNSKGKFVSNDHIDVYVKRYNQEEDEWFFVGSENLNSQGGYNSDRYYQDNEELLLGVSRNPNSGVTTEKDIYNTSSSVYSVRLNENKCYEIKFGDGITGKKLLPGDQVYVFYLDSNGKEGEIHVSDVPDFGELKFQHSAQMFGLSLEDYESIFRPGDSNITTINDYQLIQQSQTTTLAKVEDSVEHIKDFAPNWFKMGNRLLTRSDYEFFVKDTMPNIIDVVCMNNWEYLASFFKWLYSCGVRYHQEYEQPGRYYFDESRFVLNGIDNVDAADANNIYLWVKSSDETSTAQIKEYLSKNMGMDKIKVLTSEIQVLKPITVVFDICASYEDVGQRMAKNGDFVDFLADARASSYLEVTVDDQCIYVNSYINDRIKSIFNRYFSPVNCKIGQSINTNQILDEIYSINGVTRVRTVYNPDQKDIVDQAPRAIDGISLVSFSNGFIDYGEDVQIGNGVRHLEKFQFPQFNEETINNFEGKVKIIKKQLSNMSTIKF